MEVAAGSTGRQRTWTMSIRRSPLMRAVLRRLPGRVKRWLRAGRRWQRYAVAQVNSRWHRSLQFRVVSTTLVLSALVIAVLGFFLVQSIAGGLLSAAESADRAQVQNGANFAFDQCRLHVFDAPLNQVDALR